MGKGIAIDAAGTGILVIAEDNRWLDDLALRYGCFLFPGRADWKIHVTIRRNLDHEWLDRRGIRHTDTRGNRLFLRDAAYCGEIRLDEKKGSVQLAASRPLQSFGLAFRHVFTRIAVDNGWTFVHAAGVVRRGRAYLFAGPSGAGKSTVVEMLDDVRIIHDDQLFLGSGPGRPAIRAVPYLGNDRFIHDEKGVWPVGSIYFLHQDVKASLVPLEPAIALGRLLAVPLEGLGEEPSSGFLETLRTSMERCRELVLGASCHELHFSLTDLPEGVARPANPGPDRRH